MTALTSGRAQAAAKFRTRRFRASLPACSLIPLLVSFASGCAGAAPVPPAPRSESAEAPWGVDWKPWDASVFAEARREGRLILVSVQAGWCHWCHVMNHTTYTDAAVTQLLREHFMTIRVDSDARPDLAERYAEWGWPATAILTPDARPITELRGHQPRGRFLELLSDLVVDLQAGRPIAHRAAPEASPDPTLADLTEVQRLVAGQLDRLYDEAEGGWGGPQKYPFAAPVEHALFRARVHGNRQSRARALQTLSGHVELIDPVWGGMYQYSVRGSWDHPHFEKIAAVQAGAIHNFAAAYWLTGDERWLRAARAVYRYVSDRLSAPAGGFYTSQDADLGELGTAAAVDGRAFYALPADGRAALGSPRVDESVYANLNGLMISALVELYEATGDDEVLARACAAADRLLVTHRTGDGFGHGPVQGRETRSLHLSDQVEMARGLLFLHEASGEARYLREAARTMAFVQREFADDSGDGFFAITRDPNAVGVFRERRKPLVDNGIAARVLLRLARIEGDETLAQVAAKTLRSVANRRLIQSHGRKVGEYLMALEEVGAPRPILSVVGPEGPATDALHQAALRYHHPLRIVERSRPGESRYPYPGHPAIYLCGENSCSLPVADAGAVSARADEFIGR